MARADATAIFMSAVQAVAPDTLVRHALSRNHNGDLCVRSALGPILEFPLGHNVIVVGFGKAVRGMAAAVLSLLNDHVRTGVLSVPGSATQLDAGELMGVVQVMEAAPLNIPDAAAARAGAAIFECVCAAKATDIVIVLVSGGGSALCTLPVADVSLEDKVAAIAVLAAHGAPIQELNVVRKHLSRVKGGLLAAACRATMVTLVLSDVIGDPLDVIASGPTVPDVSTFKDALKIVTERRTVDLLPDSVIMHLKRGADGLEHETTRAGDSCFSNKHTIIVGNNRMAALAAHKTALALNYEVVDFGCDFCGNAVEAGRRIALQALATHASLPRQKKLCWLFAGETTVALADCLGVGKGGRNQELALAAVQVLNGHPDICVLSAGTDGQDGPTDAAGAFADAAVFEHARGMGLEPGAFLAQHDAYTFFDRCKGLLKTGKTGTNVMDIVVVIVEQT